jgi:hypothetical protein
LSLSSALRNPESEIHPSCPSCYPVRLQPPIATSRPSHLSCPLRALRVLRGFIPPLLSALRALCGSSSPKIANPKPAICNRRPPPGPFSQEVHSAHLFLLQDIISRIQPPKRPRKAHFFALPYFYYDTAPSPSILFILSEPLSFPLYPSCPLWFIPSSSFLCVHPPAHPHPHWLLRSAARPGEPPASPCVMATAVSPPSAFIRVHLRLPTARFACRQRPMRCTVSWGGTHIYGLFTGPGPGVRTAPPHTRHPSPPRFRADSLSVENRFISHVVYPTTNTREI